MLASAVISTSDLPASSKNLPFQPAIYQLLQRTWLLARLLQQLQSQRPIMELYRQPGWHSSQPSDTLLCDAARFPAGALLPSSRLQRVLPSGARASAGGLGQLLLKLANFERLRLQPLRCSGSRLLEFHGPFFDLAS